MKGRLRPPAEIARQLWRLELPWLQRPFRRPPLARRWGVVLNDLRRASENLLVPAQYPSMMILTVCWSADPVLRFFSGTLPFQEDFLLGMRIPQIRLPGCESDQKGEVELAILTPATLFRLALGTCPTSPTSVPKKHGAWTCHAERRIAMSLCRRATAVLETLILS